VVGQKEEDVDLPYGQARLFQQGKELPVVIFPEFPGQADELGGIEHLSASFVLFLTVLFRTI
jgi:hypothetical protein